MSKARAQRPGQVRIIGGTLRGRRLPVLDRPGLRPTPDRVRETLFNWLQPWIEGARVLDLCAGTGVLGLEALSRGAQHALLIEADAELARAIAAAVQSLQLEDRARVRHAEVRSALAAAATPHDLVFFDPPYAAGLWEGVLARLSHGWLAEGALLYLEFPCGAAPELPGGFELHRRSRAGAIEYGLWRYRQAATASTKRAAAPGA